MLSAQLEAALLRKALRRIQSGRGMHQTDENRYSTAGRKVSPSSGSSLHPEASYLCIVSYNSILSVLLLLLYSGYFLLWKRIWVEEKKEVSRKKYQTEFEQFENLTSSN